MNKVKHIAGRPMYSVDDVVVFELRTGNDVCVMDGTIEIVDRFGAWGIDNPREPSYDIMVDDWMGRGEPMFVKHIRESSIVEVKGKRPLVDIY